ncbi:hypothetical protein E4634_11970 [Mangrovimicrobium sediminis]|uniref:Uncharacterized protein n=1 Tax=Mangrovimicrobium sediminis TaxID=2562682 RepID=A0A4Z0M0N6_9GAMM|nr:hypothetical protein [Haliea sp. SAOS-164]TGD72997.1 hypothetical protein E4634_11970 [Haliea sp. SAOS-164]
MRRRVFRLLRNSTKSRCAIFLGLGQASQKAPENAAAQKRRPDCFTGAGGRQPGLGSGTLFTFAEDESFRELVLRGGLGSNRLERLYRDCAMESVGGVQALAKQSGRRFLRSRVSGSFLRGLSESQFFAQRKMVEFRSSPLTRRSLRPFRRRLHAASGRRASKAPIKGSDPENALFTFADDESFRELVLRGGLGSNRLERLYRDCAMESVGGVQALAKQSGRRFLRSRVSGSFLRGLSESQFFAQRKMVEFRSSPLTRRSLRPFRRRLHAASGRRVSKASAPGPPGKSKAPKKGSDPREGQPRK